MMTVTMRDVEVTFYTHHNGEVEEPRVDISIGGSRAQTWMSLSEFCEMLAACRTEISRQHWQPARAGMEGELANRV